MKKLLSIALVIFLIISSLSTLASCDFSNSSDEYESENGEKQTSTAKKEDSDREETSSTEIDSESETESARETEKTKETEGSVSEESESKTEVTETEAPPVTYTVSFMVDGEKYCDVTFAEGAETIEMPDAPEIEGMVVCWEDFDLSDENITVNAVYYSAGLVFTPINVDGCERYSVTGYTGTHNIIIIPAEYNGVSVYSIGAAAFRDMANITVVTLPDSIIIIDELAFAYCTNLEKINSIGVDLLYSNAFEGCEKLTSELHIHTYGESTVVLEPTCGVAGALEKTCLSEECGNFVRNLEIAPTGEHSFGAAVETSALTCTTNGEFTKTCEYCGYEDVAVTLAQGHHYGDWTVITSATCAADGAMSRACKYCDYKDEITVSATGNHKFENGTCSVCTTPENPTEQLVFELINGDAEYSVYLSEDALDIPTVIIPAYHNGKPVTKISFIYCPSATTLYIPETITEIGKEAFYSLKKLTTVYYNAKSCKDTDRKGTFCAAGSEGEGITLYVGASVESIPANFFTAQGSGSNYESSLVSVIFEEGSKCTSIGGSAFYGCRDLAYINLPETLEYIGSYAFSGNYGLTEITVPKAMNKASSYPFAGMYGLTTVYYNAVNYNTTSDNDTNGSSLGDYAYFSGSGAEEGITVYIGADVERISPAIFSSYISGSLPKIKTVVFDENSKCAIVGALAFGSLKLETLILSKNLTDIYTRAFYFYDFYGYKLETNVFYYGSEADWNAINMSKDNNMLTGEDSHVYFYSETAPETEGSFWHMVCGVPVIW